ncbi:MAG: DUF2834 domain-containing protein [Bacteroidota bacterium]
MKKAYLVLTIVGFALPNYFVLKETFSSGNILLWTDPVATFQSMFANNITTAFSIDLLYVVMIFLWLSYREAQQHQIKGYGWTWLCTFAFGLAGGLPLFLYLREAAKERV